jgi:AcrR family transcriptional regulator
MDQIMDIALICFIASGYSNASISRIALEAGITKPVIYTYFRSKEELYAEVLKREQARYASTSSEMVGEITPDDPEQAIRKTYSVLFSRAQSDPGIHKFLYDEYRGAPTMFAVQHEMWRLEHLDRMAAFFKPVFTDLAEDVQDAAAFALAVSMSAVCRHGIRMIMNAPDRWDPERLAELFARCVAVGVSGLKAGIPGPIEMDP